MEPGRKSILQSGKFLFSGSLILILIFIIGCGTAKETTHDPQNFDELRDLVNNREFSIEFQWAQPLGGGMIDLMSNPNHIRFKEKKVDIFLPYFGVRHRGGSYGNDSGGIIYKGDISNLIITEESSKKHISLRFEGRDDTEHFEFIVTLYENGKAHASVSSSDRTNISYQGGDVKAIPQVTEQ